MRYDEKTILKTNDGVPYYKSKIYPQIPLSINDVYIITSEGDRLDILANSYYKDPTLWWIISIANNNVISQGTLIPSPGTQLRIPVNINKIIDDFNKLNK